MVVQYGHECCLSSDIIKDKIKTTLLNKYGVDTLFKAEVIKDKIKNTIINRYGVDNVFKSDLIKNKIKNTLLDRYGVDNPTKNTEIFNKSQKNSLRILKYNSLDIFYQGTYELDFINFCIDNNIYFERGPVIDYNMNGKDRKYYSDFYIPSLNLICEVKSSWTYSRDLEENEIKKDFSEKLGYKFIFLIDKDYNKLKKLLYL